MPLVFQASAQELCQQLAQQIADCAKTENPLSVVGFTGPPGAGKSFVVDLLARLLAGQTAGASPLLAGLLPMDGFHKSNAVLATESLSDAKGTPPSFDVWVTSWRCTGPRTPRRCCMRRVTTVTWARPSPRLIG